MSANEHKVKWGDDARALIFIVVPSSFFVSLMVTLTIIVNDAPYGCERTWNAMRLANTAASEAIGMRARDEALFSIDELES